MKLRDMPIRTIKPSAAAEAAALERHKREVRARKSAAMKRAMADPEVRARHAAAMADPEVRARKSAAMKRAMADPEVRARKSALMKKLWALARNVNSNAGRGRSGN